MKAYERTENGQTTVVPFAEGLRAINDAQMGGKRAVRTMSYGSGVAHIEYKNGTVVDLRPVDVTEDGLGVR